MPVQWTYAALAAAVFAIVGFLVKQFLGEGAKHLGQRFWPAVFRSRRRTLGARDLRRYTAGVKESHDSHLLGFLANSRVTVSDVYVPLQQEVDGRREDIYRSIRHHRRTVVLGAAGAGKSMLLKNSMMKWANDPVGFERVPVFVELFRRNRGEETLRDLVAEAFTRCGVKRPERFVDRALEDGRMSVFFDGFDEIVTDRRAEVTQQLKQFAEKWPACQVVVTCRDAVYDHDLLPEFDHEVRVAGFDDAAIRRFLRLWFVTKESDRDARYEVEQMMAGLRASPPIMRLARTPLLLTMIASLHDADPGIGPMLPSSRAEFYELAVRHLLRRDSQLGRTRGLATYKAGHKLMALRSIAIQAQGAMAPGTDRRTVSESELLANITPVLARFSLEATHAPKMLEEIVDRSGLLVRVDDGNLLYEFPHLTLQEYLAAMELADSPERLLALYEENPGRWRETVKLWCGGANRDCTEVVRKVFTLGERGRLLALECLAEARQIDEALAAEILDHFETRPADDRLVVAALGAVAADPGPRGRALLGRLTKAARQRQGFAIEALAASRLRVAVETLSDLAVDVPAARMALRSTGELAIPVLAGRAKAGSADAVDDIAAVGTASAGLALADLLWDDSDVAIRAAWRLAVLVNNPDVEDELARAAPAKAAVERHDWLWAPFDARIADVMGRVGYLIDIPDAALVPDDIENVDPRVAIPIGVLGALRHRYSGGWDAHDSIALQAAAASAEVTPIDGKRNDSLLSDLFEKDPVAGRRMADLVQERMSVPRTYRALLDALPPALVVRVAVWLLRAGELRVDRQHWRTFTEDPRQPDILWRIAGTLLTVLIAGPYLLGTTRAAGMVFGWWPWGPPWLGWATFLTFGVFVLGALVILGWLTFGDSSPGSVGDKVELALFLVAGGSLLLSAPGAMVLAVPTLVGWFGLMAVLAVAVVLIAVDIWLFKVIRKREHAIANPFRELHRLDDSVLRIRSTVIAG